MDKTTSRIEWDWENSAANCLKLAPPANWSDTGRSEHCVQFYERDRFLTDSVSAFVAAGLRAGEAVVIIATEAHREIVEKQLQAERLDLPALREGEQYFSLDAAEALSMFMRQGIPDKDPFMSVVGAVVARAVRGGRRVRAFGEMVALLWAEGNQAGAIQLEKLWNELAKRYSFSLLCAYPIEGFSGEANGNLFRDVCQEHSRVIPAESYSGQADLNERLRCISLLQQRANSLEAEIAERKQVEYALREQQTKFTVSVAVAQLGIWELDLITNDLICSDQCKSHFGLGPAEPVSYERFFDLIHPEDREGAQSALRRAIAATADYAAEYRVVDPSGQLRWIASMGRCFHNGSHRMFGVTQNITERKQAAEILETTVAEHTAELQQTIGELEAFSYSISHDLRAPLRSMQGFAEILMKDYGEMLGDECRGYLERISASAERMDRLIQDVLTFSRVARSEVNLEPVNLDHLLRGIVECYPNLQPPQADILI
jgi:PAS domain S-box-containing protein